jgi:cell division protein FtsB
VTPETRSRIARIPALLLLSVALYYALFGGEYSALDLHRLSARQEDEAARLATARARVDSLRRVADLLESDPATIEQIARERFGMIRDREVLYRFVEVQPDSTPVRP